MPIPFRAATVLLVLSALACRPGMQEWRAKLLASNARQLAGVWEVQLRLDAQGGEPLPPREAAGQIALTLNEERQASPLLGEPPMVVGTYNVDLGPLGLSGSYAGFPGVIGRTLGDSVDLRLAADSKLPIELRGIFVADSVVGRWDAHSRAGRGGLGDFVLRRR